jgi:hypothetical protein
MTEEELLALLSTSPAGIRGAQTARLAGARTPLANLEAGAPPAYRVPLMRAGGGQNYVYPGFGVDPELQAATGGNTVPPGGTVTPGAPAPSGGSGIDINALLAGLGGTGGATSGGGGGSSGGGLAGLAGGAGLSVAALGALLKVAPWLARQLGLTDAQAAALTPTTPVSQLIGPDGPGAQAIDPDPTWNLNELTPTTPVSQHLGPDGYGAQAIDPEPDWTPSGQAPLTPTTPVSDLIGPDGPGAAAIDPQPGWTPGGAPLTPTTPVADLIGPDGPGALALDPGDVPYQVNASDFTPVPDAGFGGAAAGGWDPAAGAGEWSGTGGEFSGFGGPMIDPGSLGIPDASFDLMGFNIDPFSIAGGALGTFAGGKMAEASVRGDEQQQWSSKLGGIAGGALGSLLLPGIGTALGAFLGSNVAGQLGAGEPDDPFAAFDAQVFNGADQGGFGLGGVYTSNGGTGTKAEGLRTWLLDQINQRAAAQGLVANPEMVNQIGFSAGYHNRPEYNDPLFYRWREPGAGARPDDATWRGTDDATGRQGLLDQAWGDLTGKGFFARPGTTDSWQKVQQNLQADPSGQGANRWSGGEAGDFEQAGTGTPAENRTYTPLWDNGQARETRGGFGGEQGYTTWETSGGGEAGESQTPIWHAGPPPAAAPAPETAPQPEPDLSYLDQGGAARTGGLIPPTPGGTQPVPIQAHTGEFVIRPEAVQQFGPEMLTAINRGTYPNEMPDDGETDVVDGMEDEMEGYSEDGDDEDDGPAFGAFMRPYGEVSEGAPSPFERVTSQATGGDPMGAMRDLPPAVQQGMLMALGADPLIASAWLQVLGPEYQQVIAEALKAAGAMKQQQAMAMQGGAPGMMPGAPPAMPGMMG